MATPPNDTTNLSGQQKRSRRQSGALQRALAKGNFKLFKARRAARDNSFDDVAPALDDVPSNSARNEFIESRQTRNNGK